MIIRVIITGDQEVIRMFNAVSTQIDSRVIRPFTSDYAEDLRNEMIKRMHRDSGDMVNSTHTRPISGGTAVTVGVEYGEDENSRPGKKRSRRGTGQGTSHNFVEPSMKATASKKDRDLIEKLELFLRSI